MGVRPELRNLRRGRVIYALRTCFRRERERLGFRLIHYSVQHDHWHLIVETHDRIALSRGMQRLNIRCAKALNRLAKRHGPVFRDRYHANPMRKPRIVRATLAYVLLNNRRHRSKWHQYLPKDPLPDFFSSGRHFDGWAQPPPKPPRPKADNDPTDDDVVAPRTWLLRSGWLRHGLIRLDEVPGQAQR